MSRRWHIHHVALTFMHLYSAITTPHKLPYFKPIYSLRVLLTPTERRRPWLIYLTPGLLLAEILHIAYVVLILKTLRHVLLPALSKPGVPSKADFTPVRVGVYFIVCLFSTAVLTPLEVIATRLAIQRNHAAPEFNSVVQEAEGEGEEFAEYPGAEEDVIGYVYFIISRRIESYAFIHAGSEMNVILILA